jgi:FAD/FMN-containing dehydrogenase
MDLDLEVLGPDSPGYEPVRLPRFHGIRPTAVVRCRTAAGVVAALAYARAAGLPVVPRSGGHCFAGRSSTTGVVVDVSPMRQVTVEGGIATVGAGVRLNALYDALDRHGVTLPAGCGPTVGVAGLVLGGGIGLLGRSYGLTCDRLRAAQVVLADGRIVDCDERTEPDLFWALRGPGGGQFGIVTSFVFETVPAPVTTGFDLRWRYADAAALVAAWQDWAPDAPDALTAVLRIMTGEVLVMGALLGDRVEAESLLAGLVARAGVGPPDSAAYTTVPYRELKRSLAQGEEPVHAISRSEFFDRSMPAGAIGDLLRLLPDGAELAFTPMGGAYNRVPPDATAFAHRGERFLLEHVAPDESGAWWMNRSWETVHPFASGRVYANFPDPALTDWATAYHGDNYERLTRVKHAYDPDRTFTFPQSL